MTGCVRCGHPLGHNSSGRLCKACAHPWGNNQPQIVADHETLFVVRLNHYGLGGLPNWSTVGVFSDYESALGYAERCR